MNRGILALSPLLIFAFSALAQLDSSSAVLLRSSGKTPARPNLDSSRYKIRAPESRRDDDEIGEKPGTVIPTPVGSARKMKASPTATSEVTVGPASPAEASVPAPVPPEKVVVETLPAVPAAPPTPVEEAPLPPPPVTQQVRDLVGGTEEDINEAKTSIHPQDPRRNVVEIQIAPAYYYNGSQSSYSFRDYSSHGPGLGLGMNLWFTPFFGVQSRYFASVSGSVRSGGTNMVPTDITSFEGGIRFRKHFGYTRKAAHLNWGIDYHDEANKIGKEATQITGRKSSGLSVSMEAVIPSTVNYAHTVQIDIRPRMKHEEVTAGSLAKSGTKAESNAVGMGLGGQWNLDRRNQVFWKGQYSVERNLFKGNATQVDPSNGQTPDGVSVTNSLMMFYLGFKWGS
jgi:hypothetical protein